MFFIPATTALTFAYSRLYSSNIQSGGSKYKSEGTIRFALTFYACLYKQLVKKNTQVPEDYFRFYPPSSERSGTSRKQ